MGPCPMPGGRPATASHPACASDNTHEAGWKAAGPDTRLRVFKVYHNLPLPDSLSPPCMLKTCATSQRAPSSLSSLGAALINTYSSSNPTSDRFGRPSCTLRFNPPSPPPHRHSPIPKLSGFIPPSIGFIAAAEFIMAAMGLGIGPNSGLGNPGVPIGLGPPRGPMPAMPAAAAAAAGSGEGLGSAAAAATVGSKPGAAPLMPVGRYRHAHAANTVEFMGGVGSMPH